MIQRRTLLRGLGVSLALPWLDALPIARGLAAGEPAAAADQPPTRLCVLFCGNGFDPSGWTASGSGMDMQLGKTLAPLAPFRDRLLVVDGLHNANGRGSHEGSCANLLTGALLASGGALGNATSFDQLLAQRIGGATPLPSLVLGTEPVGPGVIDNYSRICGAMISWASTTTPCAKEIQPARVFDRLFDGAALRRDKLLVDLVGDDARRLAKGLGADDRRKLDDYLGAVGELQGRIARAGQPPTTGWKPTVDKPDLPRPADGVPADIHEQTRQLLDLISLAFAMDRTRIATFMLHNDQSGMTFPKIGITRVGSHTLSHEGGADYLKANRYHVEHVAHFLGSLRARREGAGTLLDNTVVVLCSNMMSGKSHDKSRLPFLIAGGGGALGRAGRLRTGRVLEVTGQRQVCRMLAGLAPCFGVDLASGFGDATSALDLG